MLNTNPQLAPRVVRDNDDSVNPPQLNSEQHYQARIQRQQQQTLQQPQYSQQSDQQTQWTSQQTQWTSQYPSQHQQPHQQSATYINQPVSYAINNQRPHHGISTPAQIDTLVRNYETILRERDVGIAHRDQVVTLYNQLHRRHAALCIEVEEEKDSRVQAERDRREALQEANKLQKRIARLEAKIKVGEQVDVDMQGLDDHENEGRKRKKTKGKGPAKEESVVVDPAILADALVDKGKISAGLATLPVDKEKKSVVKTEHASKKIQPIKGGLPPAPELTRISSAIIQQHLTTAWPQFVTSPTSMATLGTWWSNIYAHGTMLTPRARLLFWSSIFEFWSKLVSDYSATLNTQGTLDAAVAFRTRAQNNMKTARKRQSLPAEGENMDVGEGDWYDLQGRVYHEGGFYGDAAVARELEMVLDVESEEGDDGVMGEADGIDAGRQDSGAEAGLAGPQSGVWPNGGMGEGSAPGVAVLTGGIEVDFPSVQTVNPALLKH